MISYDILGLVNPLMVMRMIRRWFYCHVLHWMASYSTYLLFFHLNMVVLEKTVMDVLILLPVLGGANGHSPFLFRLVLKVYMARDPVVERIWDPKLFLRFIQIKLMMEMVNKE